MSSGGHQTPSFQKLLEGCEQVGVCVAGVELASNCRGVASERSMAFMLLTAATSLGLHSVSHGFLAGALR